MRKCLLSVDWDYFIYAGNECCGSYIENNKNIINLWYKRYIQNKIQGKNIKKSFLLSNEVYNFWTKIKKKFSIDNSTKLYVSDSHAVSYYVAKENNCNEVFLFDAHSDLGYGGISSLNFEVNCANWLGKLLKNSIINKTSIIYSPFTMERVEDFKDIKNNYNVNFIDFEELEENINVQAIHICRSGAWTPPWFDENFEEFINELNLEYKKIECPNRKWQPENLSFSDEVYYLM